MVYHPGRVLKAFPAGGKHGETAATIKFWDNNLQTVKVSREISKKVKEGDMVLVDYYPISDRLNRPRMVAIKIVDKKDEYELWSHYQNFLRMKRKALKSKKSDQMSQPPPRSMEGVG